MKTSKPKKFIVTRSVGDFVDGIYRINSNNKIELYATCQPYNGNRLTIDRDLQNIKSSIILISDLKNEFKIKDKFNYNDLDYEVKIIEKYDIGRSAHFECIAFSYEVNNDNH